MQIINAYGIQQRGIQTSGCQQGKHIDQEILKVWGDYRTLFSHQRHSILFIIKLSNGQKFQWGWLQALGWKSEGQVNYDRVEVWGDSGSTFTY